MQIHRGDIYYADLSPVVGSEQGGIRPVLIVQNDVGNRFSPTVIAAAITSRHDKAKLPTHIALNAAGSGLSRDSIVLLEQVRTLDKAGWTTPPWDRWTRRCPSALGWWSAAVCRLHSRRWNASWDG